MLTILPTVQPDGSISYTRPGGAVALPVPMAPTVVTARSGNQKIGPIPATSRPQGTCPTTCPLMGSGCYGENKPGRPSLFDMVGKSVASASAGTRKSRPLALSDLITRKWRKVPRAVRFNVVGDFLTRDHRGRSVIDRLYIAQTNAVAQARDWVAWSYTHAWKGYGLAPSDFAYVVRASCQSVEEIREAQAAGWYAAVVDTGPDQPDTLIDQVIDGRKVVQCPVTVKGRTTGPQTCADCRLCGRKSAIVAFPVHGSAKRKALRAVRALQAALSN